MGKLVIFLALFISMIGCNSKNKDFELIVMGDVFVFQDHESGAFLQGHERKLNAITILKKGDRFKIISSHQGKDYLAYKIKIKSGEEGFVIHGDNFVVKKID